MAVTALVLAASVVGIAAPAAAQTPKPPRPEKVPALVSERAPEARPEVPAGDFRNPPDPAASGTEPSGRGSFDPARSTPVDAETTASRRVWQNPDGSRTAELASRPVRFRNASGRWQDLDLSLVPGGGRLVAKAGPGLASLGSTAQGDAATVQTPAGVIVLRHPDATAAAAAADKERATYARALPGGRDLILSLTADGFKESVRLPDAAAPATYRDHFVLPPGVGARQGGESVEFVDAAGIVVGTFGGGVATDAAFPRGGPAAMTPVAVRLVSVEAAVATVEMSVDPDWLGAPGRPFPVTIDPTFSQPSSNPAARDTFVSSGFTNGEYAYTAFGSHPWLLAGNDGAHLNRSLLRFDLSSLPVDPGVIVSESHLSMWNWYTAQGNTCAKGTTSVYGLAGPFSNATTWMTQPGVEGAAVGSTAMGHNNFAGSTCIGGYENIDTTALARRWLRDGAPNHGLGVRAAGDELALGDYQGFLSADYEAGQATPWLYITYNRLPPMATPLSPADGAVLVDETPTLSVEAVTDPDLLPNGQNEPTKYWFRVGAGPNVAGGHAIDSGWIDTPSWTVPPGALADGVYRWQVFTWDSVTEGSFTVPNWSRAFRTTLRLGDAPESPTDAVGPIRANLASGNVALSHASPRFPTVGGDVGVSFAYNSAARTNGLVGEYFPDSGSHTFPDPPTPAALARTDPNVAFYWGTDSPPGPTLGIDNYLARWTGHLTTPATAPANGSYRFYVGTTDGVRVWVNNVQVINDWDATSPVNRTVLGTPITLGPGTTVPIRVEYREGTGQANVTLAVTAPVGPGGAAQSIIVPPSWLTAPQDGPMAPGWTMAAGPALAYTSARIFEHGVTLTDATGGLHTYAWNGSGYVPPPDEDGVLARDADGRLSLIASDGRTYVFDAAGLLRSTTSALDDATQSSPIYQWSTDPVKPSRLVAISDPVANRQITFRYAGYDSALPCPAVPSGQNLAPAPANKLCQIDYWNGTHTRLWYNGLAELARISEDPVPAIDDPLASVTDFAYNTQRRLSGVRDPLAYDAMRVPSVTNVPADPANDTTRTTITYDSEGRVNHLTQPAPYNGSAVLPPPRPGRGYEYRSATESWVHVDGLSGSTDEPNGFNRKLTYDPAGRIQTEVDATARTTSFVWDEGDRLTSRTDPAGRRSTTIYDDDNGDGNPDRLQRTGRVSDTFGPAPAACFAANGRPNGSCTTMPPPHVATEYDRLSGGEVTGLAVTAWDNTRFAGAPKSRSDAEPTAAGTLVGGDLPGLPPGAWSARYSGEVNLAATGTYGFSISASGSARLYIDDKLVVDAGGGGTASGSMANSAVGRHRFRVDFAATGANPQLTISWTPPGGSAQGLGPANLAPRYANPTRTTSDDNLGVPARVTTATYESMPQGLVKEETVDPGPAPHLNLVTTIRYEPGALRRPTARFLPAADVANSNTATEYAYYGNTQGGEAACGQAAGVNQAGRLRTTTAPSPDGTATERRATTVIYDAAGRVVASRVGTEAWTCTAYDGRGRVTSVSVPAYQSTPPYPAEAAHIFTYDYAVGGNPLISRVAEGSVAITTKVDLLGRVISYTDVWAKTTTSTYNQAGRRTDTAGPGGAFRVVYDPAGRVKTQSLDGALMATASYDAAGELSSASYATVLNGGNGTALSAVARHPSGMVTGLTWRGPTGSLASDLVERSQSGKVVNGTIDGVDADPAQPNFTYDAAGRLDVARVPGHTLDYGFAPSGGCGPSPAAGRNTNRTSVTDNGGNPTTYCYDRADRLTASSDAGVGTPAYDSHGNTITLGNQRPIYDGADRHMETRINDATVVRYGRDATGRIVSRTEGTTTVRYGFAGTGDSPSFTMDAQSNVIERTIPLVGGVLVTKRGGLLGAGDVWSYPNIHGDVMATANHLGTKQGATKTYDPYGQALGTLPDNSAGNFDYGWLGQHQRPLEHAGGLATIEMGARQYVPGLGRFLEVDPVEGGSANDYDYADGDPVNQFDLNGEGPCPPLLHRVRKDGSHYCKGNAVASPARHVWHHTTITASFCPGVCVGVGIQGGHPSFSIGQTGVATPGVNVGYANRRACRREPFAVGRGGGAKVGGYGSVGYTKENKVVPGDWEAGISIRPMGAWWGVNRVRTGGC